MRVDDDGPTLLGGWSATSGLRHFPRAPVCPFTGADDVEPVDLPRTGTVWLHTTVSVAPPGYTGPVPYGLGIVELDGPPMLRVVTRLAGSRPRPRHRRATGRRRAPGPGRGAGADMGVPLVSEVRITGVGLHPFGRFDGVTGPGMGVVAVQSALGEAGIGARDVQAAFCGTAYGGVAAGHRVLGPLAGTGIPIYDVEAGCASGGAALQLAAASIASGQYDRVLAFGIEKMPKGIIRSSFFAPWQEAAGLTPAPAYFALRAQRLLADTGLTAEHLAQVVVKNRRHGVDNPDAMFKKAVTVDEVLEARMICPPLTLFMLCSPNEGAAAVVLERDGTGPGWPVSRSVRTSRAMSWARTPPCAGSTTLRSRRRPRWPPTTPTPRPGSAPTTSTWSSARTPTRRVSCWPGPSSDCAHRATRRPSWPGATP